MSGLLCDKNIDNNERKATLFGQETVALKKRGSRAADVDVLSRMDGTWNEDIREAAHGRGYKVRAD